MEKGINLSMTKSLAKFDALLERTVGEVSSKKLSLASESYHTDVFNFQVGRYVQIEGDSEDEEAPVFWIGYGWEEKVKSESCLWLEFNAKICPEQYWEKLNKLVGTSGKNYSEIDFEFAQVYQNAWVHFYLREEYLKQFYDENADINAQKKILMGFIDEVLGKL